MKLGIISDVHSNLPALKTVLDHLEGKGIDQLICCGDVVGYGPNPNECIELLRDWGVTSVVGNHDQIGLKRESSSRLNSMGKAAIKWTRKVLTKSSKDFLAGLPKERELEVEGYEPRLKLVHGAPMDPLWTYIMDQREAYLSFRNLDQSHPIALFGHTHLPRIFAQHGEDIDRLEASSNNGGVNLKEDRKFLINPGSVGQPRDGNWRTSFAVMEFEDGVTVDHRRLEYNAEETRDMILRAGLPQKLGDRLLVGK